MRPAAAPPDADVHDVALRALTASVRQWTDRRWEPEKLLAVVQDALGPIELTTFTAGELEQARDAVRRCLYFLPETERHHRAAATVEVLRRTALSARVTYRPATDQDVPAATELVNCYLARRSEQTVADYLQRGYVVLAELGNRMAGVAIAALPENFPASDYATALPAAETAKPVGVLELAAVHEDHRRIGIATRLVELRCQWLRAAGAASAVCSAWVYPDGTVPAAGPLLANRFRHVHDVEQFWRAESIREGYDCQRCGNPCSCPAAIYLRAF